MGRYISYAACELESYKLRREFKNLIQEMEPSTLRRVKQAFNLEDLKKPRIIAFTGASSCGKTYLAKLLAQILSEQFPVSYFSQDNYYRCFKTDFSDKQTLSEFYETVNFDDPNHFRFRKLEQDLTLIKKSKIGEVFNLPRITFGTDTSFPFIDEESLPIEVTPIIITEGIYALTNQAVNNVYDLTFFVNMDHEVRKKVWVERNTKEGRYFNDHMWETTVESLNNHILPSKNNADIVLNNTMLSSDCEKLFRQLFKSS